MKTNTTTTVTTNVRSIVVEKKLAEMVNAIGENGMVIDNHNNEPTHIDGIALLISGKFCATFQKHSRYWSMNELYIGRDNKVHISTCSIAGSGVMKNVGDLAECVDDYNNGYIESIKNCPNLADMYYNFMVEGFVEF